MVLPDRDEPLWDSCRRFAVTHLSVVRAQLISCLATAEGIEALRPCKAVLVGGGSCPPGILQVAVEHGIPVAQTWGLTETCAQVCTSDLFQPQTCGVPLPHRTVKTSSDGRLAVAGPIMAAGYLQDGNISLPLDDAGFFLTQDLGQIDPQGRITVQGRADLVFDSGGENIQPEHIENVLLQYPGIENATVVPVAHTRWGHRPVAFFYARKLVTDKELRDFLADRLPKFCVPDAFYPWPEGMSQLKPSRPALAAIASQRYADSPSFAAS